MYPKIEDLNPNDPLCGLNQLPPQQITPITFELFKGQLHHNTNRLLLRLIHHSIKRLLLNNLGLLGTREDLNPDAIYPWVMMLQKYQAFIFGLISP